MREVFTIMYNSTNGTYTVYVGALAVREHLSKDELAEVIIELAEGEAE